MILAVSHGLPVRYVLDAADGSLPGASGSRRSRTPSPYRLERAQVERAAATLRGWAAAPRFADTPFGG